MKEQNSITKQKERMLSIKNKIAFLRIEEAKELIEYIKKQFPKLYEQKKNEN